MIKILVPTDFSPTAETAFRFAVDLADLSGGEVVLFHVFTPLENPFIDSEDNREKYNADTRAELQRELNQIKDKVTSKNERTKMSTALGRSPITDTILEYAKSNGFSLIVMGTQGASGLKKVVIGSEAGRIIENSSLPVLLVPENFSGALPKNVVMATTCNVSDKTAVDRLLKLTQSMESNITIVHVCEEKDHQNVGLSDYAGVVSENNSSERVEFRHLLSAYETETMDELDNPYDMMVMLRRKRNFMERLFMKSRSRSMAYLTDQLLLVIPEE